MKYFIYSYNQKINGFEAEKVRTCTYLSRFKDRNDVKHSVIYMNGPYRSPAKTLLRKRRLPDRFLRLKKTATNSSSFSNIIMKQQKIIKEPQNRIGTTDSEALKNCFWCRWPDSNRHALWALDFESSASANSATAACYFLILA